MISSWSISELLPLRRCQTVPDSRPVRIAADELEMEAPAGSNPALAASSTSAGHSSGNAAAGFTPALRRRREQKYVTDPNDLQLRFSRPQRIRCFLA